MKKYILLSGFLISLTVIPSDKKNLHNSSTINKKVVINENVHTNDGIKKKFSQDNIPTLSNLENENTDTLKLEGPLNDLKFEQRIIEVINKLTKHIADIKAQTEIILVRINDNDKKVDELSKKFKELPTSSHSKKKKNNHKKVEKD